MKKVLKIISKVFSLCVLPLITLYLFISIGNIKSQNIIAREGSHRTMTAGIIKRAWTYRGVYAMLLLIVYLLVLYSKSSKNAKLLTFILMIITSVPLMFLMNIMPWLPLSISIPLGILIIAGVFLLDLLPVFDMKINKLQD
ncbi:hypothetical protein [Clostridium omnivorum]|uniref:Uncharacterized protein n=1 Tax=Clostridium omnivorum TaxID=1604902 RepID=A0ABQ5NCN9_9CLOT|nr:hypothetical protein [Clostridium sp. E14]GLC32827.1 hypothetical protein bsdE14_42370 [Clostridium sp. E14]